MNTRWIWSLPSKNFSFASFHMTLGIWFCLVFAHRCPAKPQPTLAESSAEPTDLDHQQDIDNWAVIPHQGPELMAMPSEILNHILSYLFFIVGASRIFFSEDVKGDNSLRDLPVDVLHVSRTIHVEASQHLKVALRGAHLHFIGCLPSHDMQARSLLRGYDECFESVTIREFEAPHVPARGLRVLLDYNLGLLKGLKTLTLAGHGHYTQSTAGFQRLQKHTWKQGTDESCESANEAILEELLDELNSDDEDDWPFRAWRNVILADDGEMRFIILLLVKYELEDLSQGSDDVMEVWIDYSERKVVKKQIRFSNDWFEVPEEVQVV